MCWNRVSDSEWACICVQHVHFTPKGDLRHKRVWDLFIHRIWSSIWEHTINITFDEALCGRRTCAWKAQSSKGWWQVLREDMSFSSRFFAWRWPCMLWSDLICQVRAQNQNRFFRFSAHKILQQVFWTTQTRTQTFALFNRQMTSCVHKPHFRRNLSRSWEESNRVFWARECKSQTRAVPFWGEDNGSHL